MVNESEFGSWMRKCMRIQSHLEINEPTGLDRVVAHDSGAIMGRRLRLSTLFSIDHALFVTDNDPGAPVAIKLPNGKGARNIICYGNSQ
jgi:hypothetical protein